MKIVSISTNFWTVTHPSVDQVDPFPWNRDGFQIPEQIPSESELVSHNALFTVIQVDLEGLSVTSLRSNL